MVNVVPADREVSEYLVSHPGVSKVTFTGSSVAGRRIAEICGSDLRRVTLELGGKSAAILLDDADLEVARRARCVSARSATTGRCAPSRPACWCLAARQPELVERLEALVSSMPVGDPHGETTHIGPLVSERQRARVEGYIDKGLCRGGPARHRWRPARRTWTEGGSSSPPSSPTSTPTRRIAQEEIFGPVVSVIPYDTEDEAVAIANNSMYGLNGSVFTSRRRARAARGRPHAYRHGRAQREPGRLPRPMGGVKWSGIGREFGPEGLEPFVEIKAVGISSALADQTGEAHRGPARGPRQTSGPVPVDDRLESLLERHARRPSQGRCRIRLRSAAWKRVLRLSCQTRAQDPRRRDARAWSRSSRR